jgi:hypothetical protein
MSFAQKSNSTNGSWWIFQVQPKKKATAEMSNPTNGELVDA